MSYMSAQDIGFLCAWIALVGLAVERGWGIALLALFVTGMLVGILNSGSRRGK